MKRFLLSLCLLAALMRPTPSCADEKPGSSIKAPPPLQLPVPESTLKEPRTTWFGIYMNGTKSGWGVETRTLGDIDGAPCVTITQQMSLDVKAMDNVMRVEQTNRTHFSATPPHRAVLIEETQKMQKQERKVVLRHKENNAYAVEITEAGKTKKQKPAELERFLWQITSPERWVVDPARKPGDSTSMVEFSSERMKTGLQTLTLVRETDWAAPGGKIGIWEVNFVDHDEGLRGEMRLSRIDGTIVNANFGPSIEMRLEPEAIAKSMPKGGVPDLFAAMSIPADRPLAESSSLTELVIELTAPEGRELPEIKDTINQTVEKSSPTRLTLRITPGKGKARVATAGERAEALQSTQRYPLEEEAIQKLAARAVEGAKTDREKVAKLLAFTDFYISDSMKAEPLTVMDLIKNRKGDCSAHALLFTTLARASGIPSREAMGWIFMGNTYKTFGGHAWNEVILDDAWIPVDSLWGQMQLDAGHIQQFAGETKGAIMQSMVPGLKARVISFQKK